MTILIRPAQPEDSPGLGKVQLDSWRTTPGSEIKPPSYWDFFSYEQREGAWRQLLASDRPLTALAALTESGEVVGFAWTERNQHEDYPQFEVELSAIHVLPDYRRQGIGRLLIQATVRALIQQGHTSLLLWTSSLNAPARRWYEKLGGRLLGEAQGDYDGVPYVEVGYGWEVMANGEW